MMEPDYKKIVLNGKHAKLLDTAFGYSKSFWVYQPGRLILPEHFECIAAKILDADIKEDDIWVISYPKTGSTWLQEMVWLIMNDFDFHKASSMAQQLRAPMIELSAYFANYDDFIKKFGDFVDICNNWPSVRCMKTHLPYDFLPKQMRKVKPKVIYIARNPKDLCVSYYYHCRTMYDMQMKFADFAELFLAGNVPIGNVFDHYLPYWHHRDEMQLLFLKYEDFVRDPQAGVRKLATFLERTITDNDVTRICEFLTVDNMRNNPGCNFEQLTGRNVVRKGIVGDWKNHMDAALSAKFDRFIEKSLLNSGLFFESV